ncbi:MAG: hypothetical protein IJM79_01765 [Erysipelotrichaceae bacterium]|nr:hypothetical protein [Erysipelotrichaceae bacterium]
MKKLLAASCALMLIVCLAGCSGRKTFDTGLGIRFVLDKTFEAEDGIGYDFGFSNEKSLLDSSEKEYEEKFIIILGIADTFSDLRESEPQIGEDLKNYVDFQTQNGELEDVREIDKGYSSETVEEGYYYRNVYLKGRRSFYTVTFICSDSSAQAKAQIDEIVGRIKL